MTRLLSLLTDYFLRLCFGRELILVFHDIPDLNRFYALVDLFSRLMIVRSVASGSKTLKPSVTFTFDDGYAEWEQVSAFFRAQEICPKFFICGKLTAHDTDRVEFASTNLRRSGLVSLLSPKEIKNIELMCPESIGGHGYDHTKMSSLSVGEVFEALAVELDQFENLIGRRLTQFAIPYGKRNDFNWEIVSGLRTLGYEKIYSIEPFDMVFDDVTIEGRQCWTWDRSAFVNILLVSRVGRVIRCIKAWGRDFFGY